MTRFLIIDDHSVVRKGLRQILEELDSAFEIAEAGNAHDGFRAFCNNDFDIVLLDIKLPGKSGLELLADMKSMKPDIPVMIISMYPEEQYALRALKSGASAYLTKAIVADELPLALQKISSGSKYISSSIAEKIFDTIDSPGSKHGLLSNREFEVMICIAKGKALKEIAAILSINEKTVSTYRSRVLEKLNLQSNVDIVRYTIQEKLID